VDSTTLSGRLEGKVAVITGASTGIGRSAMEMFARAGAKVVGVARTESTLDEAVKTVANLGGEALAVPADLASDGAAATVMDAAVANFGGIDVLVNNAGVGYSYRAVRPDSMNAVAESTAEEWDNVMSINLGSMVSCSRHAIPKMRERGGGSIVNVASVLGLVGNPDAHAYTAAKGAMINLTRSMAVAYGKDGIRTNVVCPGYTETPLVEEYIDYLNAEERRFDWNPMGRMGTPDEIAYGLLYLASDEASYCNGAILTIDGGMICKPS
jgi:meso-butanediol dehydrogenase / (S,S)-butanediol dehydrogenase / diacetyl reductase